MTMDYQHPYNYYPEYYCQNYPGNGYQYPPQHQMHQSPQQQQQHFLGQHGMPGSLRNFNNIIRPPPRSQYQPHNSPQQRPPPQPYHSTFQQQHSQPQQHSQQQQHSNYSSPYLPNFLVSSGTGLTPTLTPTSLSTIEQSFLELQSAQQNRNWESVAQSGFVPPVIDAGHSTEASQDSLEYSSDYSDEYEPTAKRGRMSQVMKDIRNVDLIVTSTGTINAAPQRKYTRRNKDEKLPPEEEEKRKIRRERNKLAAAKCRQRRVDHTNILVAETEKLEAEQSQLESEILSLQQERDQLEFILQAHQPMCQVGQSKSDLAKVKKEPLPYPSSCKNSSLGSHDTFCPDPENLSISASSSCSSSTSSIVASSAASLSSTSSSSSAHEASPFSCRPNSLPLIKRDRVHMLASATGVTINTPTAGMSITPSSLFCPDLGSMIDGSTGLTPLTGHSCSSQAQRNGEGESETDSTLISL